MPWIWNSLTHCKFSGLYYPLVESNLEINTTRISFMLCSRNSRNRAQRTISLYCSRQFSKLLVNKKKKELLVKPQNCFLFFWIIHSFQILLMQVTFWMRISIIPICNVTLCCILMLLLFCNTSKQNHELLINSIVKVPLNFVTDLLITFLENTGTHP